MTENKSVTTDSWATLATFTEEQMREDAEYFCEMLWRGVPPARFLATIDVMRDVARTKYLPKIDRRTEDK